MNNKSRRCVCNGGFLLVSFNQLNEGCVELDITCSAVTCGRLPPLNLNARFQMLGQGCF